ncbi:MAG: hypothetical protein HY966_01045 [Ignavibacteriales bacterium]|nr:hypothetical protein [Ignavibacteriales bacterium]
MTIFRLLPLMLFFTLLQAQDSSFVVLMPKEQFIPSFTASGTEHRLSYAKHLTTGSFFAGLGGSIPTALVRLWGLECLVTVSGTVYTTLVSAGVKFQVTNADYYADVTFDIPVAEGTVLRIGSGHTSHHLVDDAVALRGSSVVLNYARDYLQFFAVHNVSLLRGFVYGGTYYNRSFIINTHRDGLFLIQLGADGGNLPLTGSLEVYGAVDLKYRGEVNFGSSQSYQIGIRAKNEFFRAARLAYTYRTGMEERGQFYDQRITTQSIGLFFDF